MFLFSIIFISAILENKIHESNGKNVSVASGDFPQAAVIEGYAASVEEFPFAVRVYIFVGSTLIFCTGQIVHRKLVLTAAHCVEKKGSILVVTGNADQEDYIEGKNLHKYARYRVIETFIHPKFSRYEYIHDVAIVKLGRSMIHSGFKILPLSYEPLKGEVPAVIYGWGGTEKLRQNHQLYAKSISIKPCKMHFDYYQYVCLIGQGICHGDSGGGVIVNGCLQGIASFFDIGRISQNRYYYIALWEEKDFLDSTIRKNGANYNRCFLLLAIMSFIFII